MIAFIVWSGISALWSSSPRSALYHTLVWSLFLIFYLSVRQILENRGSNSKLLSSFAFPLMFFAVLALAGYLTVLFVGNGSSLGIVYSKYGEQLNAIFPLLLLGLLRTHGKRFAIGLSAIVLLWLLIFSSSSRTNLGLFAICLVVSGVAILSFKRFRRFRWKFATVTAAIVLAPIALNLLSLANGNDESPTASRFSDTAHLTGSDDFRKLMIKLSADMIAENPLIGVGADNFGFRVNEFRSRFAERNPDDLTLAQAETTIPERAHNEYLQIAAELGLVGVVIFAWFLFGIARMGIIAIGNYKKMPLHGFAALLGLALFLASSLVTSYSFRLVQNGFVFFVVLAVAVRVISKFEFEPKKVIAPVSAVRFAYAFALIACVSLAGLSVVRVASVALTTDANSTAKLDEAIPIYEKAMTLDPEDPHPHYYLGLRYVEAGEYEKAVPLLKESIRIGKAPSSDYSYLATAQSLANDNQGAEKTFAEAANMYPRSTFVLTRYAALLKANGKDEESAIQIRRAQAINESDANGWLAFINSGGKVASDLAFERPGQQTKVMDLRPYESIYAVLAERDIRYPDERQKFPWEKLHNREGSK